MRVDQQTADLYEPRSDLAQYWSERDRVVHTSRNSSGRFETLLFRHKLALYGTVVPALSAAATMEGNVFLTTGVLSYLVQLGASGFVLGSSFKGVFREVAIDKKISENQNPVPNMTDKVQLKFLNDRFSKNKSRVKWGICRSVGVSVVLSALFSAASLAPQISEVLYGGQGQKSAPSYEFGPDKLPFPPVQVQPSIEPNFVVLES